MSKAAKASPCLSPAASYFWVRAAVDVRVLQRLVLDILERGKYFHVKREVY